MSWTMNVNPLGNLALSALVALVPILFLFIALTVLKMKGHWAAIVATSLAVAVACIAYGMPLQYAGLSVVYGALFGLFPVSWIVITALFIYNMSVKTGQFEVVKNSLATISDDRRMQALLIAFSFGAFIEGAAGFGTPVAITAAMLAGLGFNPLFAARLWLLANKAPGAFCAIAGRPRPRFRRGFNGLQPNGRPHPAISERLCPALSGDPHGRLEERYRSLARLHGLRRFFRTRAVLVCQLYWTATPGYPLFHILDDLHRYLPAILASKGKLALPRGAKERRQGKAHV